MLIPIDKYQVPIGRPAPWDIVDQHGHILLARGKPIRDQKHLDQLAARGMFRRQRHVHWDKQPDSPLYLLTYLKQQLANALRAIAKRDKQVDHPSRIRRIVQDIFTLAWQHPDPALGTLLYNAADTPYTINHPLLGALITAMIGKRIHLQADFLRNAVTAALVNNVGMLALQEQLTWQSTPLTPKQQARINEHPLRSSKLIYAAGLVEPMLILYVMRHHERPNGQGYPEGLAGNAVPEAVQLLGLVDMYAAMILPRGHREGMHAQAALKHVFLERGEQVNAELGAQLIHELGPYPVGSHVRLKSGEIAIVTQRNTADPIHPEIKSIMSVSGKPFGMPLSRDPLTDKASAIVGCVAPLETRFDPQYLFHG